MTFLFGFHRFLRSPYVLAHFLRQFWWTFEKYAQTVLASHGIRTHSLPDDFSKPIQIDLPITKPGVFHYFIEYDASATLDREAQLSINGSSRVSSKGKRIQSRIGAFNVDPILQIPKRSNILSKSFQPLDVKEGGGKVGSENVALPTDGLVIQSVIAKWMGTIDQWDKHLDVTRDRGYNMFHFTPLQQRGESGSPYSIYDQMAFDDALFQKGSSMSVQAKQKGVKDLLSKIRTKWGILSMTDVVWNHTANNSQWLQDHPESGMYRRDQSQNNKQYIQAG